MALSSAEVELYASVQGSSDLLRVISVPKDFGLEMGGYILSDASAALGVIKMQGLGELMHLDCASLRAKNAWAEKSLSYSKVAGSHNLADSKPTFFPLVCY